jgi:hypothetical protein
MRQVEAGDLDELELEEDHRIDAGAATITVACLDPVADKAEVEGSFEMAVEVIGGDEPFERNQDGRSRSRCLGGPSMRLTRLSSGGGPPVYPSPFIGLDQATAATTSRFA